MATNKQKDVELIDLSDLHFDPENPRFSRLYGTQHQPEAEVVERMVSNENVQELMGSIGEQDYFNGEPLLVAVRPEGGYTVVEGNRRLAALKLLSGAFGRDPLPSITALRETAKHTPTKIPCIAFPQRRDILRYLGYRHITGAKKWDSLSKARYISQLRDEFFKNIDNEEMLKAIAKEIGSKKGYVAQMLTGLAVYDDAKSHGFYGLQHVKDEDVDFSLLTTALSYTDISEYVGLESRTDIEIKGLNREKAKDLFSWIYAQDQQGNTILGESRQLKKLAAIVKNEDSVTALKQDGSLELAYIYSEGPTVAFSKALNEVEMKVKAAYSMFPNVRFFDEAHIDQVGRIYAMAEDLDLAMRRAIRRKKSEE